MKIVKWTYEELSKVLDDRRSNVELAKEGGRTVGSIRVMREQAARYKEGNLQYASKRILGLLKRYFEERYQLSPKQEKLNYSSEVVRQGASKEEKTNSPDECMVKLQQLTKEADELFEKLRNNLMTYATLSAEHWNHQLVGKNQELEAWKKQVEPELASLREFKQKAQGSNFSSMLHRFHR